MTVTAANTDVDGVYFRACMAPLAAHVGRADVTDIYINRPGEIWIETIGGDIQRIDEPSLDEQTLERLARQVAALAHQGINREHPLLSARLPDGSRIQFVSPPATRGSMAVAIRRHLAPRLMLADYAAAGTFKTIERPLVAKASRGSFGGFEAFDEDVATALTKAVRSRKNILVSGGTSSGKTTFLNALLREVALSERLILIEDTPELSVDHPNHVGLVAARGELAESSVSSIDLLTAALRMRPDRIILGELRGAEAFAFLRTVNSGHPGSMTTIHADSPERAIEQLVLLVLQAGTSLTRADIHHYVTSTIDVFVHLDRTGGRRLVQAVSYSR